MFLLFFCIFPDYFPSAPFTSKTASTEIDVVVDGQGIAALTNLSEQTAKGHADFAEREVSDAILDQLYIDATTAHYTKSPYTV